MIRRNPQIQNVIGAVQNQAVMMDPTVVTDENKIISGDLITKTEFVEGIEWTWKEKLPLETNLNNALGVIGGVITPVTFEIPLNAYCTKMDSFVLHVRLTFPNQANRNVFIKDCQWIQDMEFYPYVGYKFHEKSDDLNNYQQLIMPYKNKRHVSDASWNNPKRLITRGQAQNQYIHRRLNTNAGAVVVDLYIPLKDVLPSSVFNNPNTMFFSNGTATLKFNLPNRGQIAERTNNNDDQYLAIAGGNSANLARSTTFFTGADPVPLDTDIAITRCRLLYKTISSQSLDEYIRRVFIGGKIQVIDTAKRYASGTYASITTSLNFQKTIPSSDFTRIHHLVVGKHSANNRSPLDLARVLTYKLLVGGKRIYDWDLTYDEHMLGYEHIYKWYRSKNELELGFDPVKGYMMQDFFIHDWASIEEQLKIRSRDDDLMVDYSQTLLNANIQIEVQMTLTGTNDVADNFTIDIFVEGPREVMFQGVDINRIS